MANHVIARVRSDEVSITAEGFRQVIGASLEMTPTTNFDLGSVTKILCTTSLLMKLTESHQISLDDYVSRYLSQWNRSDKRSITVRDLLEHQSGLNEWRPLYISCSTPQEIHTLIAEAPLKYVPHSGRHYSDLGFITLGHLIESVTASSLDEIFHELISIPLELDSTQFASPIDPENVAATSLGDIIEKRMVESGQPYPVIEKAETFSKWRSHVLVGEVNDGNSFHGFAGVSGHAGLFSNAVDLSSFIQELIASMNGEGYFSPEVINSFLTMTSDQQQALGFRRWQIVGQDVFGHTGFPGVALGVTRTGLGFVYLSNRIHAQGDFPTTDSLWLPLFEREINL